MAEAITNGNPSIWRRFLPEGALSAKQKRYGVLAVIFLVGVIMLFSGGKNDQQPTVRPTQQPTPAPVQLQQIRESSDAMRQDLDRMRQARAQFLQSQETVMVAAQSRTKEAAQVQSLQQSTIQRSQFGQEQFESQRAPATGQVGSAQAHASPIGRIGFDSTAIERTPTPQADILPVSAAPTTTKATERDRKPLDFDPSLATYWLPQGTIIETVLTNRLQGETNGPVNVMVTTPTYAPGSDTMLIPTGARVIGTASAVSAFGQQRLAVSFDRLLIQRGARVYSVPLDAPQPGLDQEGAAALHDKVNSHYPSIFGGSLAIGVIGGLANIGNYSTSGFDAMSQFRSGVSQSMAQSSERVLDKFLNRMPTITIREGTRVRIMLTGDVQIPAY